MMMRGLRSGPVGSLPGAVQGALGPFVGLVVVGALVAAGITACGDRSISEVADTESPASVPDPLNLVIVVLDAARADHFGAYGYPRDTTPHFDRFAAEGTLFERHFTTAPMTKPSTASLFSGLYPDTHLKYISEAEPEPDLTMASAWKDLGYSTLLISSNPFASPELGNGASFESIFTTEEIEAELRQGEAKTAVEPMLRLFDIWLGEKSSIPFFAYLHFLPPHLPYKAPEEIEAHFAEDEPAGYDRSTYRPGQPPFDIECAEKELFGMPEWLNLYDANLSYGDQAVGEVRRLLEEEGLWDSTVVVITSDHGEAFGEHGYQLHQGVPYDEGNWIPLAIRIPGRTPGQRVSALTQTVDLFPTLAEIFGQRLEPGAVQGHSLVPVLDGQATQVRDYGFILANKDPKCLRPDASKYLIRSTDFALLLYGNGLFHALYDLERDAEQNIDVLDSRTDTAREIIAAFREFAAEQERPLGSYLDSSIDEVPLREAKSLEVDPETRKKLEALGYL